jgi:hypothetical protein
VLGVRATFHLAEEAGRAYWVGTIDDGRRNGNSAIPHPIGELIESDVIKAIMPSNLINWAAVRLAGTVGLGFVAVCAEQ